MLHDCSWMFQETGYAVKEYCVSLGEGWVDSRSVVLHPQRPRSGRVLRAKLWDSVPRPGAGSLTSLLHLPALQGLATHSISFAGDGPDHVNECRGRHLRAHNAAVESCRVRLQKRRKPVITDVIRDTGHAPFRMRTGSGKGGKSG